MTDNPEFHEHVVPQPLTRAEIEDRLNKLTLKQLREIAQADGIPVLDDLNRQREAILFHWFPARADGSEPSFQELVRMADQISPGQRRVWKKRTHGKELGF